MSCHSCCGVVNFVRLGNALESITHYCRSFEGSKRGQLPFKNYWKGIRLHAVSIFHTPHFHLLSPMCNPVTSPRLLPPGGRRRSSHLLKISKHKRKNSSPKTQNVHTLFLFLLCFLEERLCVSFVLCFICQFSVTMMCLLNGHIPSRQSTPLRIADAELPPP